MPQLGDGVIIVAEDLTPSDVANLDISKVKGICTALGGPTSHVAILSATMGIPALVSLGMQSVTVANGANIILNADNKSALFYASDKEVETAKKTILERNKQWQQRLQAAQVPVTTKDNVHIDVLVNVRDIDSLQLESSVGADGVGLLRSEFLFLDQQTALGEEEQLAKYQRVADSLHGRPITYRTLDAGGDKPMVFLPLPYETNPALGLRGIRSSFFDKTLFRTQLRAILRVKPPQQRNILLSMITFLNELLTAKQIIEKERSLLGAEPVEVGIMIEVPAAAVMADVLAQHVDFLSIGTNDLTQYTLAMDREHREFSSRMDALHPAVLRLIKLTTEGASAHGKPVCVCGAIASDHAAIPVLIGLGVTKLSTTALALPEVKEMVRRLDSNKCREIAERALRMASAEEVRDFLATAIFDNLPLLFAIGVAVGWAKENNGAAGLAGAVGYFVLTFCSLAFASTLLGSKIDDLFLVINKHPDELLMALKDLGVTVSDPAVFTSAIAAGTFDVARKALTLPTSAKALGIDMGVLAGIFSGLLAGTLYNRYCDIKLLAFLAFFGGRRFVPIITGFSALFLGLAFAWAWPVVGEYLKMAGQWAVDAGPSGKFIYGFLNRILIVTGLHHIVNSLVWFDFGEFIKPDGSVIRGDLWRFFAGDASAGGFMTGFFPVMMFGLPGAALAMFVTAKKEKRAVAGGGLIVSGSHFTSHWCDRANGIWLYVSRTISLRDSCTVNWTLPLSYGFCGSQKRIYFLGGYH